MRAVFSKKISIGAHPNTIFETDTKDENGRKVLLQFFGIIYKTNVYRIFICDCVRTFMVYSKFQDIQNVMKTIEKTRCTKNACCFFTGCVACYPSSAEKKFVCPFPCATYNISTPSTVQSTSPKKSIDSMEIDTPAHPEEVKKLTLIKNN